MKWYKLFINPYIKMSNRFINIREFGMTQFGNGQSEKDFEK